jgi:hypothetical protein
MKNTNGLILKQADTPGVLKDFIRLPYSLYKNNRYWVPPLISEEKRAFNPRRNVFLEKNPVVFYVCYKDNQPVGRIAGIINKQHNEYHNDKTGFFGFFECIDDENVSGSLFSAAQEWLKKQGADSLRGPTNFTINETAGLLIDGFEEIPFILMPYNHHYYEKLYRKSGLDIVMRFFAYELTDDTIRFPSFLDKLEKRLEENEIHIRPLDFNNMHAEFETVIDLFNHSWKENWGFVPYSIEEAVVEFKKMKPFARPELILIAEQRGKAAGFAMALPDINQALKPLNGKLFPFNWLKLMRNIKKIDRIRVLLMGVLKEYRSKGIDLMFYKKIVENSVRNNFHRAELSWILENNTMMNRVLRHINAKKNKIYGIFERKVTG